MLRPLIKVTLLYVASRAVASSTGMPVYLTDKPGTYHISQKGAVFDGGLSGAWAKTTKRQKQRPCLAWSTSASATATARRAAPPSFVARDNLSPSAT